MYTKEIYKPFQELIKHWFPVQSGHGERYMIDVNDPRSSREDLFYSSGSAVDCPEAARIGEDEEGEKSAVRWPRTLSGTPNVWQIRLFMV